MPFTKTEKNRESLLTFNLTNFARNLPFTIAEKNRESFFIQFDEFYAKFAFYHNRKKIVKLCF